ncbi:hypothetical protein H7I53_16965 [Mycolicibacterium pulveris]|uniref:Uncharacterized protein n=1 Tax=Mycolicibacterium pulveris TaxID=36813 RepID=A0A7I7UDS8_MYCPV|nr:hypothetical protein [Mycolicibacterium pulveris]MCV6981907.1 hypothetical protein [Mycolicibacterium pulveris]BBY79093.1 hypothetical protein MPUL_02510 [Mycolicibacterium pulveris]
MTALKDIGSVLGGAAVIAATVGLTAGLAPASAAPQQSPGVTLTLRGADPAVQGNLLFWIQGVFPMSEGSARDRIDNLGSSGGMDYIVFADDPGEPDSRIGPPHGFIGAPGPPGGYLYAGQAGIHFGRHLSIPEHLLNEDKCFDDGSVGCTTGRRIDEIYVSARFVQSGTGSLLAYTNPVSAQFDEISGGM